MLSYVRDLVAFLIWRQPPAIVTIIAALTAVGVIASAVTPVLLRRRWNVHVPAMGRLPLPLIVCCLGDWLLPRARFLCRPEIASVDLLPQPRGVDDG